MLLAISQIRLLEHLHRAGLFAIFGRMTTYLAIGRKKVSPTANFYSIFLRIE
jgi:hypothetical protein